MKNYFKKQNRRELENRRTRCTKIFQNEDLTMTAAIYGKPVHFKKNGVWQDYDNSLEESGTEGDVENLASDLKVKFANKSKDHNMIQIRSTGGSLSWGPENCEKVRRIIGEKPVVISDDETLMASDHQIAVVTYEKVWKNTDLEYILDGGKLKENIILQYAPEDGSFSFNYRSTDLQPKLDDRGVIHFEDKNGSSVFTVAVPYMTDAAGQVSERISLTLSEGKNKHEAAICVDADMEWLASTERIYPVKIDPVVTTSQDIYDIQDVHVSSYYNTDNFENSHMLKTGYIDGSTLRSYLKFSLPSMNPADMVIAAQFRIVNLSTASTTRRVNIHKVTQSWDHNKINWNNKPSYDTRVIDYCSFTNTAQAIRTFDITNLVKDWYINGKNYGLMMKDNEEVDHYTEYLSADTHDAYENLRPCIAISYVNYSGLEDYWTYHQHGVGRAGCGYVNDYNGNHIFIHPTLMMTGNRAPITLNQIFNSNNRGMNIGYGKGFMLNYHQTMTSVKIGSIQYYKHVDGDGTEHYFAYDAAEKKWKDESCKELVLTIGTDAGAKYTITDKGENKQIFNSAGLMVKVSDVNGNAVTVTYGTGNKITRLTDGVGRVVVLTYNSDGNLEAVKAPDGRSKTMTYENGWLIGITDVDGKKCTYTYDKSANKGMMLTAADPFGYKMTYSYDTLAPYRMRLMAESADGIAGKSMSMAYGYNKTRFTDNRGRKEIYLFDNAGRTISIRNDAGYAAACKYLDSGSSVNKLSNVSALQFVPVNLLIDTFTGFAAWTKVEEAGGTLSVNTSADGCYIGSQSLKMQLDNTSEGGTWGQTVSVTPGKDYVFSAYMRHSQTDMAADAFLGLKAASTSVSAQSISYAGMVDDWQRIEVGFAVPASSQAKVPVSVSLTAHGIAGTVFFDCMQLEEGKAASRFNLIRNSAFMNSWDGFKGTNTDTKDCVVKIGSTGQTAQVLTATAKAATNMRKGPGTSFAILKSLPKGTAGVVIGVDYDSSNNKWYILRVNTSTIGYVLSKDVSLNGSDRNVTTRAIAGGNDLNIRKAAGTSNSAVTQVSRGQIMSVNGAAEAGGVKWYKVSFVKGGTAYTGYVSCEYVAVFYPSEERIKVNTDVLNVRVGPGTSFARSAQLIQGAQVTSTARTVMSNGDQWLYISFTYNGSAAVGYVSADYMNFVSRTTAPTIPVQELIIVPDGNGPLGDQVFRINGVETKIKRMKQILALSGKKGDNYVANAWAMASSVPLSGNRHFGLLVSFKPAAGDSDDHYSDFGADTTDWQFLTDVFVAKKDYTSVEVSFIYDYNANPSYFTGIAFYKELFGTSYVYDNDGNIVTVKDQANKSSSFEYDSNNNIKKMIDPKGSSFTYTYDDKHRVTEAVSAMNMKYAFSYDAYGNVTKEKQVNAVNAADYMSAETTYTANGNYTAMVKDANGHTAAYDWEPMTGKLKRLTDAMGRHMDYTYNNADQIQAVTGDMTVNGVAEHPQVEYTYDEDVMKTLVHNGFEYRFTKDGFGRNIETSVAGTKITGNVYEGNNGLLKQRCFSNGWTLNYQYDKFDRITSITAENGTVSVALCTYVYDKQGGLAARTDCRYPGKTEHYAYDITGRVRQWTTDDGQFTRYAYDDNDNISRIDYAVSGEMISASYIYDKDNRETKLQQGDISVEKTYDSLGRGNSVKYGGNYTTSMTYAVNADGTAGSQVVQVSNNGTRTQYTYDSNGNILTLTDSHGVTSYVYNEQNFLIRENNAILNQTLCYSYDKGGNMTERRIYAFTNAEDLSAMACSGISYGYAADWKDKLVDVSGRTMTYDICGNMLSDGIRTYTWTLGRQLESVTTPEHNVSFTYDASGRRIRKTADGMVTEYLWDGGKLIQSVHHGVKLKYIYDSAGILMALRYGEAQTPYYYIRNTQSDILGLVDTNGQTVVEYSYDSWGNIIGITGSLAGTVGGDNPFRYRGYIYDSETGLYHLTSRYYDPEIGRFTSADIYVSTGQGFSGNNMFTYCGNNPVNMSDPSGCLFDKLKDLFEKARENARKKMENLKNGLRLGVAVIAAYIKVGVATERKVESSAYCTASAFSTFGTRTNTTISSKGGQLCKLDITLVKDENFGGDSSLRITSYGANRSRTLSLSCTGVAFTWTKINGNSSSATTLSLVPGGIRGEEASTVQISDTTSVSGFTALNLSLQSLLTATVTAGSDRGFETSSGFSDMALPGMMPALWYALP